MQIWSRKHSLSCSVFYRIDDCSCGNELEPHNRIKNSEQNERNFFLELLKILEFGTTVKYLKLSLCPYSVYFYRYNHELKYKII